MDDGRESCDLGTAQRTENHPRQRRTAWVDALGTLGARRVPTWLALQETLSQAWTDPLSPAGGPKVGETGAMLLEKRPRRREVGVPPGRQCHALAGLLMYSWRKIN